MYDNSTRLEAGKISIVMISQALSRVIFFETTRALNTIAIGSSIIGAAT